MFLLLTVLSLAAFAHGDPDARLLVRNAASTITIRVGDLHGLRYAVTTAAALVPSVALRDGTVELGWRESGRAGRDDVSIVLDRAARWDIRLPHGAGELRADLRGGRLAGLSLGVAGRADLRLPRPYGVVPIVFTDAAGTVHIDAPAPSGPDRYVISGSPPTPR